MQRRTVLKQIVGVTGIAILMPGCMEKRRPASIQLNALPIDGYQEEVIAEVAKTIIPDAVREVKNNQHHLFVLTMIDDCYSAEEQQKFISGFIAFELAVTAQFNKTFLQCNNSERESFLQHVEETADENDVHYYFYSVVKNLTIQSFTTTQTFLISVQGYALVPGHYSGCIPLNTVS